MQRLCGVVLRLVVCFFFQAEDGIRDLTVTGVQTCALPISGGIAEDRGHLPHRRQRDLAGPGEGAPDRESRGDRGEADLRALGDRGRADGGGDRKSTRLNSSHSQISYAVFCLKKKKKKNSRQ